MPSMGFWARRSANTSEHIGEHTLYQGKCSRANTSEHIGGRKANTYSRSANTCFNRPNAKSEHIGEHT